VKLCEVTLTLTETQVIAALQKKTDFYLCHRKKVMFYLCLFVNLSVSCLSTRLLEKLWPDFDYIFWSSFKRSPSRFKLFVYSRGSRINPCGPDVTHGLEIEHHCVMMYILQAILVSMLKSTHISTSARCGWRESSKQLYVSMLILCCREGLCT